jgi:hypothetical protein
MQDASDAGEPGSTTCNKRIHEIFLELGDQINSTKLQLTEVKEERDKSFQHMAKLLACLQALCDLLHAGTESAGCDWLVTEGNLLNVLCDLRERLAVQHTRYK